MVISEKKTKAMIFNYTDKYQLSTRLQLKGQNVQIVDQMKILGTVVNSDLTWTDNCSLKHTEDIERTQKTFQKLILKQKYENYENALLKLSMVSLEKRIKELCLKFAKSGIKHEKLNYLFPTKSKEHDMEMRKKEVYNIQFANTERLKKASVITIQNYLNDDAKETRKKNIG